MTDLDGAVTINNSGADADFIVESDGNANAIFVNAGDDRVTFFNGTTVNAASGTDDGVSHYSDGRTDISRASAQPLNLRRRTDDGILQNFYKEASGTVTNVGSDYTTLEGLSISSIAGLHKPTGDSLKWPGGDTMAPKSAKGVSLKTPKRKRYTQTTDLAREARNSLNIS